MLLAGVDDEQGAGELLHFLDAAQVLDELLLLGLDGDDFLLGKELEVAVLLHLLDGLEPVDAGLDGLEVGEHTAQPPLVHVELLAALGFLLNGFGGLLLGADEKDILVLAGQVTDEVVGLFDFLDGHLQVDDVDAVALGEDIGLHLGVPTAGLVAEMYTGLQQLLHRDHGHE